MPRSAYSCLRKNRRCMVAVTFCVILLVLLFSKDVHQSALVPALDLVVPLVQGKSSLNTTNSRRAPSVKDLLEERKHQAERICARIGSVSNRTIEISGIRSKNMSYCVVPKAGCTMWIRLFKYLAGQNLDTGDPMTLSKYLIHNQKRQFYKLFNARGKDSQFIKHSLRVMTVRDPYTRLWSAYIDKFLLPDFWFTKGTAIVRRTRQKPNVRSLQCGHDVTFPEFIEWVVTVGHDFRYLNQDKHWLPATDICDPCFFKPDIIGKQESFMQDFTYTLKEINLDYLLPKIESVNPTEFEIKEEIDYNFKIFPRVSKCTDKYELSKRLWTAFILNGYLPSEEIFPSDIYSESLNAESFYELVKDVRERYNITKAQKKSKRKHALVTAFKQIPEKHMKLIQKLYEHDFEIFSYDSHPKYFYENIFEDMT